MATFVRVLVLLWADILAGYAVWVMSTYLTDVWGLNVTDSAKIINLWGGLACIMPIATAFLVDTCMGDYYMLSLASVAYSIGLGFLSLSTPPVTGSCKEYNPECIGDLQKNLFYTGLALIAVGMSGHGVCLGSFLKKQQPSPGEGDSDDSGRRRPLQCLGVCGVILVPALGGIALLYIKPWSLRFGIPAICTVVATALFFSGSCVYRHTEPQGWKLCRVTAVEETKFNIRMIPLWLTLIICGVVSSVGNTYYLEQANNMNRKLGRIMVPLPILLMFYDISKALSTSLYFKFAGCLCCSAGKKYIPATGMATAMASSVLCCITAALVETRRLDVIRSHGLVDKPDERIPMSIFWLLPQYFFLGSLDGISERSLSTLFQEQAPSSMSSYLVHVSNGVKGLGIAGSVVSVSIAGRVSERGGKPSWFQDSLSKSRLDNYYWTLSAMSAVNLVLYIGVVICFTYRDSDSVDDAAEGNDPSAPPYEDAQCCCCCA